MDTSISKCVRRFTTLYIYIAMLLACTGLAVLTSCSEKDNDGSPVSVRRLDRALRADSLPEGSDMRLAAETLFSLSGYGQLTDSTLQRYNQNPSIRLHDQAMDSLWGDMSQIEAGLGRMQFNFSKIFPDSRFPAVYTVVSPFNQSVFTADSLLFLGLNHYFGPAYQPYSYFPDYIRARKTPSRILPDVAEAIVRGLYPYNPAEDYPTVLSRLLYEGALLEAVMQLSGNSEQQSLGYDDESMAWAEKNERRVWETMAERKMIFSTDPQLSAQLVTLAPFTSVINSESPGSIGRFIGHRIVTSYLDHHALTIPELLSPAFYESPSALPDSRYK